MSILSTWQASEGGNAVLEFIAMFVALVIPLIYVGSACWTIASHQLSISSAAHAASRAAVLSKTQSQMHERVNSVIYVVMTERHQSKVNYSSEVMCEVASCLTPGKYISVRISNVVRVWVPLVGNCRLNLSASHTSVVDEYS